MAFERIEVDPATMTGMPVIRGTRVTVASLLGQLAARRSIDEVLADFPYLEADDVYAALAFAATAMAERQLPLVDPV